MKNLTSLTIPAIILALAIITMACSNSHHTTLSETAATTYSELEKASWLIGTWQNNSSEGRATERWQKENDSTFTGISYFIAGADTVSLEKIMLTQSRENLFYIPIVKNQNGGQPVKFTMTYSDDNKIVFENPAHDFPQKIAYTKISTDSLVAEISGTMNGEVHAQQFPLGRIK